MAPADRGRGSLFWTATICSATPGTAALTLINPKNGLCGQRVHVSGQAEIPQINSNQEPFGPIYETDLENHIINGVEKKSEALQQEEEVTLLRKDFQLYEALMLVKGLALKSQLN